MTTVHNVHATPSNETLAKLLRHARVIALVGASSDPSKPSNRVMKRLLDAGYHVIPVNPNEQIVLGQTAVPSLDQITEPVDIVDVFRRAEATPAIAEQAVRIGAQALWLQLGIINDEAAAHARAGGLVVVMDKCIAVVHSALNVPAKAAK